jgi:hypothetical protein
MEKAVFERTDGGHAARTSHERWIKAGRPKGPATGTKKTSKYDPYLIASMRKSLERVTKGSVRTGGKKYDPKLIAAMRRPLERL